MDGADQAHLAFQNVEELWKFVDAGLAQESADQSNARVFLDLKNWTVCLIPMLDILQALLCIDHHGAELEDMEHPLVQSQAFLHEEDRARRSQLHQERGQQHHGRKKSNSDK